MRSVHALLATACIAGCAPGGSTKSPAAPVTATVVTTTTPATTHAAFAACRPSAPTGATLEIVVLGSGGPVPGRRACASHAVLLDGVPRVLVDAGPGAAVRLGEAELDTDALDVVLLTHLHVDHSGDLPGVVKARDLAHDGPLSFFIAGPEGRGEYPPVHALVDAMLGPHGAFAYLAGFKNGLDIKSHDLPIAGTSIMEVLDRPGLRIKAVATNHGEAPAIAYRIEHAGHAVVFGGDTTLGGDAVTRLAAGADVLVANATVLDPPASPAGLYALHASPSRIGQVARDAHVGAVVLAHVPPVVAEHQAEVVASVARAFPSRVALANDCDRIRADGLGAR